MRTITSHLRQTALMTTALVSTALFTPAHAADAAEPEQAKSFRLEEIIVTAQKVEKSLQDSAIAVTAVSGDMLAKQNIVNYADLAGGTAGLSFTEGSPLDQEINIRGVVSVRIDAPSADPSIGTFIDGAYVGRTGQLNTDFFDIERVEVIRGPQGVLLGKNVVGGALSIITASPKVEPEGMVSVSYGNYNDMMSTGYITGGIADGLSGRLSYRIQQHDGYARDVLHDRDLEDKKSAQFRAQLLYQPDNSDLYARLVFDYSNDSSNGIHRIGENIDPKRAGTKSFSRARALVAAYRGGLSRRESISFHPTLVGDSEPTSQFLDRESWSANLTVRKNITDDIVIESISAYRHATSSNLYSQTGINAMHPAIINDTTVPLAFDSMVYEEETFKQFSQELTLSSDTKDSRFDWMAGAYFQRSNIDKNDVFQGLSKPAAYFPTRVFVPTLSGESRWFNEGENTTWGVFAQGGFDITDSLKLTVGGRYTEDKKTGSVRGLVTATGDFFNPNDTIALTPMSPAFPLGGGYTTDYGKKWKKFTPQAILEFKPMEGLLTYFNVAKGFKGGGFEDTPSNAAAAREGFDPETVTSYEVGAKFDFWDGRARVNAAAFYMDYKDLQVTQTNAVCLCNITDNAGSATTKGLELEVQLAVTEGLRLFGTGTYLHGRYKNFTDSLSVNNNGNKLQRTPDYQFNVGFDFTTDIGGWQDGLNLFVNYSYKGKFHWDPDNITVEKGYGLLDGRLSISPTESIKLSAYGKNILGKDYRAFVINFFGDDVASLGSPGTYGVELAVKF